MVVGQTWKKRPTSRNNVCAHKREREKKNVKETKQGNAKQTTNMKLFLLSFLGIGCSLVMPFVASANNDTTPLLRRRRLVTPRQDDVSVSPLGSATVRIGNFCSGVLIHKRWVLSVGHCADRWSSYGTPEDDDREIRKF